MHSLCASVNDMRFSRKRFSISGSLLPLLLLLVLLVAQTSGRPSSVNGTTKDVGASSGDITDDIVHDIAFDADEDYADVDNVEWHHVKIVDGVMHEDHPIIMYKEDFVSEDYDPSQHNQNKANSAESAAAYPRRKYKHLHRQRLDRTEQEISSNIKKTEKYRALKPEKIYFDILPPTPVVVTDDSSSNDSKFDPSHIRVEVISLVDAHADADEDANNRAKLSSISNDNGSGNGNLLSKELLNKRPKKYQRRMRRDTTSNDNHEHEHTIHKRHPHYNYQRVGSNSFDDYNRYAVSHWGPKHPVAGNKWNGIDGDVPVVIDIGTRFGSEDNTERVIWGSRRGGNRRPQASKPTQQEPQLPPLIHNSNPDDADFTGFTTRRPTQSNNRRPFTTTRRPQVPQEPQLPPLFHNSNPNDADFSGFTRLPPLEAQPATQAPRPVQQARPTRPTATSSASASASASSSNAVQSTGSSSSSSSSSSSISQCVWAIVNCCSNSNSNIRYECFERLGCRGVFWDLNPCADNVKNSVLDYVDQYQ